MTKEEVAKRQLLVKEDSAKLKEFQKIAKSPALIQKKLIEELNEVGVELDKWMKERDNERKSLLKRLEKQTKKKVVKKKH